MTLAETFALPRDFNRTQQIERAAYELAIQDAAAAMDQLAQIENPADRATFLRGMFTAIAQLAPHDALQWLKRLPEGNSRDIAMNVLATAWRGGLPPLRQERGSKGEVVSGGNLVFHGLSPEGALAMSLLQGSAPRPEMAVAWAQELVSDAHERASVLGAAARQFGESDPARVTALFNGLANDEERAMFSDEFASAWVDAKPEAAWRSAMNLPDGELRDAAEKRIFAAWSGQDPAGAATAAAALSSSQERALAISVIGEQWGSRDTRAALAWAGTLTGDDRVSAENAIHVAAPVGIGAVLGAGDSGYPVVRELLPSGVADRSGQLPAGSVITAVVDASGNTIDMKDWNLADVVKQIRGPQGSRLTVIIQKPGSTALNTVELLREQIVHTPGKN